MERLKLGNGKWETAKYNERLQVTQIGSGSSATDTSLLKLDFGYGTATQNNGSMRSQKISFNGLSQPFEQTYAYDDLNRLQTATETVNNGATTTWKQTFQYDRFGNRRFDAANTTNLSQSSPTKVTNPLINTSDNRLKKDQDGDSVNDYDYDKTGNLIQDSEGKTFLYDAENHQKEVLINGVSKGKYLYDGEGKRVKKISDLETTIFVYNGGGQLVAEYSTQQSSTPQVSYLTSDHLGSPRIITDNIGKVIARKDFNAFGDETNSAQRTDALGYKPEEVRQDYTGYQKDDESGLEFAQARYYNNKHGRFTSVDPLVASANVKDPQTFNRYSYAMNSPYKFTDPLGLVATGVGQGSSSGGDVGHSHLSNNKGLNPEFSDGIIGDYKYSVEVSATVNSPAPTAVSTTINPLVLKPPRVVSLAARVSESAADENAFLNRAKQSTDEVTQFSSGQELLGALEDFSDNGDAIGVINVHDHGYELGIIGDGESIGLYTVVGAKQLKDKNPSYVTTAMATTEDFANAVKSGSINLAKNADIKIFGCNTSEFAKELSVKLKEIAGRTDIFVTGANNFVYEKNGQARVDSRTTGLSQGKGGLFFTYRAGGQEVARGLSMSYK
jgi:RHS repeat-associated protein